MSEHLKRTMISFGRFLVIAAVTSTMLFGIFYFGFSGAREQEATINRDLLATQIAAAEATEALICTLAAPLIPTEAGNTVRDEGFVNSICLIPHNLEPFDVNGDGEIDKTRPEPRD